MSTYDDGAIVGENHGHVATLLGGLSKREKREQTAHFCLKDIVSRFYGLWL